MEGVQETGFVPCVDAFCESSRGFSPSYLGRKISVLDPRNHSTLQYLTMMFSKNLSGFRYSASALLKGIGAYSSGAANALTSLKFVNTLTLPLSITSFFSASKGVIKEKQSLDKVECGVSAVAGAGSVLEGSLGLAFAAMAFRGLCAGVKVTTPVWMHTLWLVSVGFSVFSLVVQTSGIVRTYYCVHKMNEALGDKELEPEERVKKAIEFLQAKHEANPKYLNKKFGIKYGSSVMQRLQAVRTAGDQEKAIKEAQKELKHLKRRAWKLIGIKGLKITAIALTLSGVAVLTFTPYGYVGYALVIAAIGVGMAAATAEFQLQRSGRKDPKGPKKKYEPPSFPRRVFRLLKHKRRKGWVDPTGSYSFLVEAEYVN